MQKLIINLLIIKIIGLPLILFSPSYSFAASQIDSAAGTVGRFYMHGRYTDESSFELMINADELSKDSLVSKQEMVYTGSSFEDTLKQFQESRFHKTKLFKIFDDLFKLLPSTNLNKINDITLKKFRNNSLSQRLLAINAVRENLQIKAWKNNETNFHFLIQLGTDSNLAVIRQGSGPSLMEAFQSAILNQSSTLESKLDALFSMRDSVEVIGSYSNKNYSVKFLINEFTHNKFERTYEGRDFETLMREFYEDASLIQPPPSNFTNSFGKDLDLSELTTLLEDDSRKHRILFSITKQNRNRPIQFKIFPENNLESFMRWGEAFTLTRAIQDALIGKDPLPRSKIDQIIRLNLKDFEMQGAYNSTEAQRHPKAESFLISASSKSSFGVLTKTGDNFKSALGKIIEAIENSPWGQSSSQLLNFKNLIDLDQDTLNKFELLLRDSAFYDPDRVEFRIGHSEDGAVKLEIHISRPSEMPAVDLVRSGSGPHLSDAIYDLLKDQNILKPAKKYLAADSTSILNHYKTVFMSPEDLRKDAFYRSDDPRKFKIRSYLDQVQFSADSFCRYFGFTKVRTIDWVYRFENYKPGEIYEIDVNSLSTNSTARNLDLWDLPPAGKTQLKEKFKQYTSGQNLNFSPHIIFQELICGHDLPPSLPVIPVMNEASTQTDS